MIQFVHPKYKKSLGHPAGVTKVVRLTRKLYHREGLSTPVRYLLSATILTP